MIMKQDQDQKLKVSCIKAVENKVLDRVKDDNKKMCYTNVRNGKVN
jgi:hypothetical protein